MPSVSGEGSLKMMPKSPPKLSWMPPLEKIEFWVMKLPALAMPFVPPVSLTPVEELNAIVFDASVTSPEITAPMLLPMGNVPVTSVPMKLSWTTPLSARDADPTVAGDHITRPGLRAAHDDAAVAGIACRDRDARAPVPEGSRAGHVGADQVPLHVGRRVVDHDAVPPPEIRLRAAGVVPPIVFPPVFAKTPYPVATPGKDVVPVASVPM